MLKYNLYNKEELNIAIKNAVAPSNRAAIICDSILFITDNEENFDGYVNATRYCINKDKDELIYAGKTDISFTIEQQIDVNRVHFDFVQGGIKCWVYDARLLVDASCWSATTIDLLPKVHS